MNSSFTTHHHTTDTQRQNIKTICNKLTDKIQSNDISVFSALLDPDYTKNILDICENELSPFDHLVVFGTGGAALGGMTLCQTFPLKLKLLSLLFGKSSYLSDP